MKHLHKFSVLTLIMTGLFATHNALAEPTDTGVAINTSEAPKYNKEEGRGKRLEILKSTLKLTASQETAWTEWVDKIKGDHKNWGEMRKNAESFASLPAPERMEKMLAFSKEHIAKQEARLAATKVFYATLSPEQRLAFDKGFSDFRRGGRFGRHSPQPQQQ